MSERTASTALVRISIIDGYLVAVPNSSDNAQATALADYLGADIQSDNVTARELLRELERIEEGYQDSHEESGNLCAIYLDRDGVAIENMFSGEPPVRLTHAELRQALEAVLEVLKGG